VYPFRLAEKAVEVCRSCPESFHGVRFREKVTELYDFKKGEKKGPAAPARGRPDFIFGLFAFKRVPQVFNGYAAAFLTEKIKEVSEGAADNFSGLQRQNTYGGDQETG